MGGWRPTCWTRANPRVVVGPRTPRARPSPGDAGNCPGRCGTGIDDGAPRRGTPLNKISRTSRSVRHPRGRSWSAILSTSWQRRPLPSKHGYVSRRQSDLGSHPAGRGRTPRAVVTPESRPRRRGRLLRAVPGVASCLCARRQPRSVGAKPRALERRHAATACARASGSGVLHRLRLVRQSEGNAMFQFLAVADPTDPATARALGALRRLPAE